MCLGSSALTDWETLLIREGYITHNSISDELVLGNDRGMRLLNRDFLLFSMVLFDKIDSSRLSLYNLERLVDLGIVEEHAHIAEEELKYLLADPIESLFHHLSPENYVTNQKLENISEVAEEIMRVNKSKILTSIDRENQLAGYLWTPAKEAFSSQYRSLLKGCEFWASDVEMCPELGLVKEGIMKGLYTSDYYGSVYYDGTVGSKLYSAAQDDIDDMTISRIMRLDLSPELYHFPVPKNMDEVIMLRKRPEIKVFREMFFNWCYVLKRGEFNIAEQVKADVARAQKDMEKYYKWESGKTKLFNCLIDVIVGEIPYLSTILGAISPFTTRQTLKRRKDSSWILLLR